MILILFLTMDYLSSKDASTSYLEKGKRYIEAISTLIWAFNYVQFQRRTILYQKKDVIELVWLKYLISPTLIVSIIISTFLPSSVKIFNLIYPFLTPSLNFLLFGGKMIVEFIKLGLEWIPFATAQEKI